MFDVMPEQRDFPLLLPDELLVILVIDGILD